MSGGPGPGGSGLYDAFAPGVDGKLYMLGSLDGTPTGWRLFRLDGAQLTAVATPPYSGSDLTAGPSGIFYVLANYEEGSGYLYGHVWILDLNSGTATLLAMGTPEFHVTDPVFGPIAYDPEIQRLYLVAAGKIWGIWNTTPTRTETWGAVKARYLGRRPNGNATTR